MPIFRYRCVDNSGRSISGLMVAHDEPTLEEKLKTTGFWLLEAKPEKADAPEAESRPSNLAGTPGAVV